MEFDWTQILKGQGSPAPAEPEIRRERRERPRHEPRPPRSAQPEREPPPAPEVQGEAAAPAEEPTAAAHARLGSEGLARLRARFSEVLARIDERVVEAERRNELKSLAERLNPDGWVTDADVTGGLESYETTFAALRSAIGPRRKPDGPAAAAAEPRD